jgi:hypothetical protein
MHGNTVIRLRAERPETRFWQVQLFSKLLTTTLRPTQPPTVRLPCGLATGYSGRDVNLTVHLHLVRRM